MRKRLLSVSSRRYRGVVLVVAAACVCVCLWSLHSWLPYVGIDLRDYILPWYEHILAYGRWHSMEGSFANYSPPYLYLLSGVSLWNGRLPEAVLVKLAVVPFVFLAAVLTWRISRRLGCDRVTCWGGAALVAFLPELTLNSYKWGQCDILQTSLLLGFVLLFLRGQRTWGMAVLGAALATKLQVIFAGPAVLALVLAGEIPLVSLLAVPVAYAAMLVPAFLAGRPWRELAGIYGGQYTYYTQLSMGAANPYVLIQRMHLHHDGEISMLGVLVAGVCGCGYVWYAVRHPRLKTPEGFLLLLTGSLLLMPYLLPKMHERYFFAGDCLLVVLALRRQSMAVPAVLVQAAAVLSYLPFLNTGNLATMRQMLLPLLLETVGLGLVLREIGREARGDAEVEARMDVGGVLRGTAG